MSLLGNMMIAGGVSGGAEVKMRQIQEMREKRMREAEREFQAGENAADREARVNLAGMDNDAAMNRTQAQIQSRESIQETGFEQERSLLDIRNDYSSEENELSRAHDLRLAEVSQNNALERQDNEQDFRTELTREQAIDSAWTSVTDDDGNWVLYNGLTQEQKPFPDDLAPPSSGGNSSYANSRAGFAVKFINDDISALRERIADGMAPPEEEAAIQVRINDLVAERNALLFGGSQSAGSKTPGQDIGDALLGPGDSGSATGSQGRSGNNSGDDVAPPPQPGSTGGSSGGTGGNAAPRTFGDASSALDQQDAAEQQEAEAQAVIDRRKSAIDDIGTAVRDAQRVRQGNPRQKIQAAKTMLEQAWNDRDDWTEDELETLTEYLMTLRGLEDQVN